MAPPDDERRQALTLQGMAPAYWAGVEPDRPALVDPDDADQSRSYAQLNGRVNQLVRGLRAAGLREGDMVEADVSPNGAMTIMPDQAFDKQAFLRRARRLRSGMKMAAPTVEAMRREDRY